MERETEFRGEDVKKRLKRRQEKERIEEEKNPLFSYLTRSSPILLLLFLFLLFLLLLLLLLFLLLLLLLLPLCSSILRNACWHLQVLTLACAVSHSVSQCLFWYQKHLLCLCLSFSSSPYLPFSPCPSHSVSVSVVHWHFIYHKVKLSLFLSLSRWKSFGLSNLLLVPYLCMCVLLCACLCACQ